MAISHNGSSEAICVFCGSSSGNEPIYIETAREVGHLLASARRALVYGGGRVGLMGAVADGAMEAGGKVIGVMPRALVEKEIAHTGLTELHAVDSMHERKVLMSDLAAGFVALPGGAGTLEEAFEQWTWAQLGLHAKPLAFLNVAGYFDPLIAMVDNMVRKGFLDDRYRQALIVSTGMEEILDRFERYAPPSPKRYERG